MGRFRIVAGNFVDNGPDGKQRVFNADGSGDGSIIDTDQVFTQVLPNGKKEEVDLADRFGHSKFQRLGDSEQVHADVFEDMSTRELKQYAEDNEIELGDATRRADLARNIRRSVKSNSIADTYKPLSTIPSDDETVKEQELKLDRLNVVELHTHASKNNIDLGGAKTKAEILAAIRRHPSYSKRD